MTFKIIFETDAEKDEIETKIKDNVNEITSVNQGLEPRADSHAREDKPQYEEHPNPHDPHFPANVPPPNYVYDSHQSGDSAPLRTATEESPSQGAPNQPYQSGQGAGHGFPFLNRPPPPPPPPPPYRPQLAQQTSDGTRQYFSQNQSMNPAFQHSEYNNFRPSLSSPLLSSHAPPPQQWYPPDYDARINVLPPPLISKDRPPSTADKQEDKVTEPIVREGGKSKTAGKLIPRQITKKKVLPEGLVGKVTQVTKDSVNEELRKNAYILGKH